MYYKKHCKDQYERKTWKNPKILTKENIPLNQIKMNLPYFELSFVSVAQNYHQ